MGVVMITRMNEALKAGKGTVFIYPELLIELFANGKINNLKTEEMDVALFCELFFAVFGRFTPAPEGDFEWVQISYLYAGVRVTNWLWRGGR